MQVVVEGEVVQSSPYEALHESSPGHLGPLVPGRTQSNITNIRLPIQFLKNLRVNYRYGHTDSFWTNYRNANSSGVKAVKAGIHQAGFKELASDQKAALEHTAQTTADGRLTRVRGIKCIYQQLSIVYIFH